MKVLYLTNVPSPYRIDFFNELGKYCDLTVTFERTNASDRDSSWVKLKNDMNNFNAIFLKGVNIDNDSAFCPQIINVIKSGSYDCIIVGVYSKLTSMLAMEYMRMKKIPFIINTDGGFIKKDKILTKLVKKYFISHASAWLSTGKMPSKYLEYYGANSNEIYEYPFTSISENEILRNTLSLDERLTMRSHLNITEEKIIVSVGRFSYNGGYGKGYDTLLKVAKKLGNDVGIYIIGGEPTQEFVDLKNELKANNVHFVGFKTKNELQDYYKSADVFCLLTRGDVWGLVINEAMACGLPIVTTNMCIAGLELVKNGENGFITSTENVNEIALRINEMLNDMGVLDKMREQSLQKIKFYTIENMAKTHYHFFENIRQKNIKKDKYI